LNGANTSSLGLLLGDFPLSLLAFPVLLAPCAAFFNLAAVEDVPEVSFSDLLAKLRSGFTGESSLRCLVLNLDFAGLFSVEGETAGFLKSFLGPLEFGGLGLAAYV
jgi:hypothetical protein